MSSMQEDSVNIFLVDNAIEFHKSLQELKDFRSQVYQVADYCETTFLSAENKTVVMENTKQYVAGAIVAVVDHLGSISANLESSLSKSSSISETEHKIDTLTLRLVTCQQSSHKLALARFYSSSNFSRHHSRYIVPPLADSAKTNVASRDTKSGFEAKGEKEEEFETEEPLFLHTYNCKPSLAENSASDMEKKNGLSPPVVPVRGDVLSILPKSGQSIFRFQEAQKLKRIMINWKHLQNNEIASLIRRGKRRILA